MKITEEELHDMGIGPSHFDATLWVVGAMLGTIILIAFAVGFAATAVA